jgi:hypothetical protein
MEISVIFKNGEARNVSTYMLDQLIRDERIVSFLRSDGWVQIGRDPIRRAPQSWQEGDRWGDSMLYQSQSKQS